MLTAYCLVALGNWFGCWRKEDPFVGELDGEFEGEFALRTPSVAALRLRECER